MTVSPLKSLALAVACAASAGALQAQERQAPHYQVQDCCSLCPAAHDASLYTTNYMKNFITLMDAEEGWLFRSVEDLRTEFGTSEVGYQRLKELRDGLKQRGVELVVVYQPTRGLVNRSKLKPADYQRFDYDKALANYRQALARFEQLGIWVPDLSGLTDEDSDQEFYFRRDQHWTPYGAERTARLVAETVKRIPGFEDIPRKEFVTERIGLMGKTGTMQNVASQLCGTGYAVQYVDQFVTEPKDASGGDALFGDDSSPQITLIGTSHSGKNYNFGGFLEEYLGTDVLNAAFPGGGLEGAMLEYLASESFQTDPPKILIWEFSPLYDLASDKIHRQLMATLNNGCSGTPARLSAKTRLRPGSNEVLVNGENKLMTLAGNRHQLDIRFSDPSVKRVDATIWYLTGRREQIKLEKPDTVDTDGRFAIELRNEAGWGEQNFFALEIEKPEDSAEDLEVEAALCQRPGDAAQVAQRDEAS
ncbi:alginate O-acetyltransferase [Pseudomonas sp. SP16.1]|uniref:alginate O-acetyltransferase n=1 Tax=Pseudomonas sp. SP16.1 TaxID=3458854 RepID=UPI004045855E